jgi:PTH2 family peptidyl-tRNA hydrolase
METKQVIVVRKDLNMRKGKLAAQVAHASMAFITRNLKEQTYTDDNYVEARVYFNPEEEDWLDNSFTKVVVGVDSEDELMSVVGEAIHAGLTANVIIDSGKTEFNGVRTITCAAIGPHDANKIDKITGDLKLL